jgi:hypothetical protein
MGQSILKYQYYGISPKGFSENPLSGEWTSGQAMILTSQECVRIQKHFQEYEIEAVPV